MLLEKSLQEEREAKGKLKHGIDEAHKDLAAAEKQVHRLQSDLKFDKMAREGQVKRARIIEHELTEIKHDNFLQTKLRKEAEHRSSKTFKELQIERSMRLQDIHARNKVIIAKNTSERNEKLAEFHRFKEFNARNTLESQVNGLEAAIKSQTKIISLNDSELNASLQEIEEVRLESAKLKKELQEKSDEVLHHVEIRTELEQECHRLQTEMMVMARTHSDRTRPLSTAAAGKAGISLSMERARSGKTRPETTSAARIRRRAQTIRNREFSRTFTTSRGGSRGASRGGSRGGGGLLALMPPGSPVAKGALTLDEAFIIPIDADPVDRHARSLPNTSIISTNGLIDGGLGQTSPDGRLGTASVTFGSSEVLDGKSSPEPRGRLPSAIKKTRRGSTPSQTSSSTPTGRNIDRAFGNMSLDQSSSLETFGGGGGGGGGGGDGGDNYNDSDPFHVKLEKRKKHRERTTLNTPGSLFLGSGLGLRKE